jgi:hypothetical protein
MGLPACRIPATTSPTTWPPGPAISNDAEKKQINIISQLQINSLDTIIYIRAVPRSVRQDLALDKTMHGASVVISSEQIPLPICTI